MLDDKSIIMRAYKAFVRSEIEYGSLAYWGAAESHLNGAGSRQGNLGNLSAEVDAENCAGGVSGDEEQSTIIGGQLSGPRDLQPDDMTIMELGHNEWENGANVDDLGSVELSEILFEEGEGRQQQEEGKLFSEPEQLLLLLSTA